MQPRIEKATLAWTNVWIDSHKTKERGRGGREGEKVNVGVVNPLIAVRGGYTTQYSKTNTKFLHGLHLLRM